MQNSEILKYSIVFTTDRLFELLKDMDDHPFTFPTPNGGNHPLWVMGHLAYVEGLLVHKYMLGEKNPLRSWGKLFGVGTEPVDDPDYYPPYQEVLQTFRATHQKTVDLLDSLSDEELAQPSKGCPEGYEDFIGTYWKIFMTIGLHTSFHKGQIADSRRALGKKPAVI